MSDKTVHMRIDVDDVLRQRAPRYYKFIPRFIIKWLEKTICQKDLNRLLQNNADKDGVDFCEGVIRDLDVEYRVHGSLPQDDRRVIIVSNHPLGGLDGMILSDMVSKQYGGIKDIKFVVNDLLTFVEPLNSIFLGVNKHGSQSKEAAMKLDEAFEGDEPMLMFPAGLCSRKGKDGGIADLRWHKMVVSKAISSQRNIIPVHFGGQNSQFFYKFARLRVRLGLKFNIEMTRLPAELVRSEDAHYTLTVGKPIPFSTLRGGKDAQAQADELCRAVYGLVNQQWK